MHSVKPTKQQAKPKRAVIKSKKPTTTPKRSFSRSSVSTTSKTSTFHHTATISLTTLTKPTVSSFSQSTFRSPSLTTLSTRGFHDVTGLPREVGTVKWFDTDKGYGFLLRPSGAQLFVHFTKIRPSATGLRTLDEGERVDYAIGDSNRGPNAFDVIKLPSEATSPQDV